MPFTLQSLTPLTVTLYAGVFAALIAATSAITVALINRKKPSSVKAGDSELEARARNLEIQSIAELLEQLRDTNKEVSAMGVELTDNRRQNAFLRDQVRYHEELTIRARQAAHAALDEVQRCYWAITLRDESIEKSILLSPEVKSLFADIPKFVPAKHEDLVNADALPFPPPSRRLSE